MKLRMSTDGTLKRLKIAVYKIAKRRLVAREKSEATNDLQTIRKSFFENSCFLATFNRHYSEEEQLTLICSRIESS